MDKIILTTTASFSKTVDNSNLKIFLARKRIKVLLTESLIPPFSFDVEKVLGIVAGHTPRGKMIQVGRAEKITFPNLKVVMPFGIGTDHINKIKLEDAGVLVKTLPPISKRTVAEFTIAFILALARRIKPHAIAMKEGVWQRISGNDIYGKCLGLLGLGNIGKEVAKMATALGMKVIAKDVIYDNKFLKGHTIKKVSLKTLISKSDFISIHTPLTDKTRGLIDEQAFSAMRSGVFIINTSRGAVINEKALLDALKSGRVAGAALDVFSIEPPFKNPTLKKIISHPNVITTPHIGGFTLETRYAISKKVCEEISATIDSIYPENTKIVA